MAKIGKLTKLKSAIKRWPSLSGAAGSCVSTATHSDADDDNQNSSSAGGGAGKEMRAVYVGKSRRRYLVNADVVEHPVFQELVDRPASEAAAEVVVACEVVLFQHLLWMLETAETNSMGSVDDLVHFYTCASR